MDENRQREIASKGGQAQGKANNPANFANDRQKASEAGRKGGQARGQNQQAQQQHSSQIAQQEKGTSLERDNNYQ